MNNIKYFQPSDDNSSKKKKSNNVEEGKERWICFSGLRLIIWSIDEEDLSALDEFEREAALRYRNSLQQEKEEKSQLAEAELGVIRCPICTGKIPCPHFLKDEVLREYLDKKAKESGGGGQTSQAMDKIASQSAILSASSKKLQSQKEKKGRAELVLAETQLDDRKTDRSIALVNQYRLQDIAREKQSEQERKAALLIEQKRQQNEEDESWKREEEKERNALREMKKKELLELVDELQKKKLDEQGLENRPLDQNSNIEETEVKSIENNQLNNEFITEKVEEKSSEVTFEHRIDVPQSDSNTQEVSESVNVTGGDPPPIIVKNPVQGEVLMVIKPVIKLQSSYNESGKEDKSNISGNNKEGKPKKPKKRVKFSFPDSVEPTQSEIVIDNPRNEIIQQTKEESEKETDGNLSSTEESFAERAKQEREREKDIFTNPLPMNKRKIFLFTGDSNERFDLAKPSKTSEQSSVNEENLRFIVSGSIFLHLTELDPSIPQPIEKLSLKLVNISLLKSYLMYI